MGMNLAHVFDRLHSPELGRQQTRAEARSLTFGGMVSTPSRSSLGGYSEIAMTHTAHRYIVSIPEILGGEPVLQGTRTAVRAVVELWRAGTPAEEITLDLPHLTLAQVFDALSYYSAHCRD